MPLSEHEQRLLEQMERALYAEDPKFATSLRGKDPRSSFRRRLVFAIAGFVLGVVLLMVGLLTNLAVSVLGFLFMLAGTFLAVTSYRAAANPQLGVVDGPTVREPQRPRDRRQQRRPGFMERMEQRWERRRDENGL